MRDDNFKSELDFYRTNLLRMINKDERMKCLEFIDETMLSENDKVQIISNRYYKIGYFKHQTLNMAIASINSAVRLFISKNKKYKNSYHVNLLNKAYDSIDKDIVNSNEFKQYIIDQGYVELLGENIDWKGFGDRICR